MFDKSNQNLQSLIQTIRNNFSAFLLGLTVLLVIILVVSLSASRGGKQKDAQTKISWAESLAQLFRGSPSPTPAPKQTVKTYVVKEGDHLWSIAEATYGSGYNAFDIASTNKLANPDLIEVGQNLVLPSVAPKTPTTGEAATATTGKATTKPSSYTVQNGDNLWQIAQTYYGDGYVWVKIAQANKLANPDLIYAGTKLTLP